MNRFERLRGTSPLVVYIDLKSPYAYIAIEPTRAAARAAGIQVEWRPFTLDIPSFLGSARLDARGKVVESHRSESQWNGVRYAYRDARRYARLAGRVLRGTEKIWDSSLAGIGLLWAREQSGAIVDRYLDACYARFWRRELDIEDLAVVTGQLAAAGADVAGFAQYAAGAGREAHDRINHEAFAAGIFGVPGYLVADEFWWGREHLPRIAWLLGGRAGPSPDPAYQVPADPLTVDAGMTPPARDAKGTVRIRAAVDIRDPEVWLAWDGTLALARDCAVEIEWLPFEVSPPAPPPAPRPEEDRGAAHRRLRAEYHARGVDCYAADRGLDLVDPYRQADASVAHLGLLWARQHDADRARKYLGAALAAYWSRRLDPADSDAVCRLLKASGIDTRAFPAWAADSGRDALLALRTQLQQAGVFQVPDFLVGAEPFHGRAHLPLLRALLAGGTP